LLVIGLIGDVRISMSILSGPRVEVLEKNPVHAQEMRVFDRPLSPAQRVKSLFEVGFEKDVLKDLEFFKVDFGVFVTGVYTSSPAGSTTRA
jgi:hypothetical protein